MGKKVWKFPLHQGINRLQVPNCASLLYATAQGHEFVAWALVDPNQAPLTRTVQVVMTGEPLPLEPSRYLGTGLFSGGAFVLHAFEVN